MQIFFMTSLKCKINPKHKLIFKFLSFAYFLLNASVAIILLSLCIRSGDLQVSIEQV